MIMMEPENKLPEVTISLVVTEDDCEKPENWINASSKLTTITYEMGMDTETDMSLVMSDSIKASRYKLTRPLVHMASFWWGNTKISNCHFTGTVDIPDVIKGKWATFEGGDTFYDGKLTFTAMDKAKITEAEMIAMYGSHTITLKMYTPTGNLIDTLKTTTNLDIAACMPDTQKVNAAVANPAVVYTSDAKVTVGASIVGTLFGSTDGVLEKNDKLDCKYLVRITGFESTVPDYYAAYEKATIGWDDSAYEASVDLSAADTVIDGVH